MDLKTKELLTLFTIDPQELLNTYGQATLVRGLDYFNKERVQDIEQALPTADDGVVIVGRVSNGRGKTYVVRLELYPGKRGFGLAARSDCNCPVGDECKHGVALLFTFLSQLKALDSDPEQEQISAESQQVVRWLAGIEGAEDTLNVSAMTDERYQPEFHMIHLMSIRSYHGKSVLWIESVKSRVLKKGGYGKPAKLQYHHLSESEILYGNKMFCTDDEVLVCKSLSGSSYGSYVSGQLPNSTLGESFLSLLLKTGRCFWGEDSHKLSHPLTEGVSRDVTMEWVERDELMIPELRCNEPYDELFRLSHFYYIDLKNHQCGQFTHDGLTSDQMSHLLDAPPVPKVVAEQVSEKLLELFPTANMPLPKPIVVEEVTSVRLRIPL